MTIKKLVPYSKDECCYSWCHLYWTVPRDTIPLTRSNKLCITALLLTVRTSGQFLTDALRWVQRGKRPPAYTLPVRCPTTPSSTDPGQRVRCVLFVVPRIHQRMRNVKRELVKQASNHNVYHFSGMNALNAGTQFPWSNVSRDGNMYSLQVTSGNTQSLQFGPLSGGATTTFATTTTGSLTGLEIVGWTTM